MKNLILSLFIAGSVAANAQGPIDGFFKSRGELDIALSGSFATSEDYFTRNGKVTIPRDQTIIGFFASYGLSDRWNLVASIPVINFQLQDAAFYVKYKWIFKGTAKGEFSLFPALGVSFPLSNYDFQTSQAIGQKAVTVQPKMVSQFKSSKGWFIQGQTGYNYAFDPVPSAFVASVKLGYIYKKWYFDAWFDLQYGIGGKDYASFNAVPLNSFRELGVSHQRVGGVVYRTLNNRFGVQLNGSYVLSGRNASQMLSLGAGVVIKMNTHKK